MSLAPDDRLGAYKILALLGEGAMGEDYRARDVTLGREVALRVLPEDFVKDPKQVARFRTEVQILTALNHPRFMGIYGLSDENRTHFLILEFVPTTTLAERMKAGPLAVGHAVTMARQIGEALRIAQDKGIVSGDLTPANIAFTANDRVKLLDFGLARAMEAARHVEEKKKSDKRDDVWGFGCVLYEMLAGKPAFAGDDAGGTLSGPPEGEPDWSALPADTPESVRNAVKGCLEKDLVQRLADIPAVLSVMDAPVPAPAPAPAAPATQSSPRLDIVKPRAPRETTASAPHPRPRPAPLPPPAAQPVSPFAVLWSALPEHWRLAAMVAVPVVLVLLVGTYLLVGRSRVQPEPAPEPAPQVEAPVELPSPEVTATPGPDSTVVLSNTARPAPAAQRLTSGALDQAINMFSSGSAVQGLQELDRLAEVSKYQRRNRVLTDEERGLHRQLFLDRADRNVKTDLAKTEDSLRELIRVDPMYSPRLAPVLQQRLDAVRASDTGTLRISSAVTGATLRVNGVVVGVAGAAPLSVRVMPGEVEVRAHKDDYPRDSTTRVTVTAGAVAVADIAPRRVAQPVVLVTDRPDADVYVRKASSDKVVFSLDPRVNGPTDVMLNRGVAQRPVALSIWKTQMGLAASAELERRVAATGLAGTSLGVFVVPPEAIEYNRAIQVLFLKECYKTDGKRIVLTEAFLKANDTAPLLWLGDTSIVRLAPDPIAANLPQCQAVKR